MNTEKKLYQWDTGQKLTGCTGLYVDFPIDNEVYRVETIDGTCIIPDELLQTSGSHKVYECMTNNTIRSFAFSVTPRPQPPDYVFTPTERLTFEGLVQKVDDAVADMIRRADSGEFDGHTPVKGTDYFTASEIQQIQNEVSSGAIGEFKSVVDTKTETFNTNAETKLNAYNQNDSQKTTAYNTNATAKLNAYNTNANNKVAEFDAHTEQIQTDISELKSDIAKLTEKTRNLWIWGDKSTTISAIIGEKGGDTLLTPNTYYLSTLGTGNSLYATFFFYNNNNVVGQTTIYQNATERQKTTVTISENVDRISIVPKNQGETLELHNIQLELDGYTEYINPITCVDEVARSFRNKTYKRIFTKIIDNVAEMTYKYDSNYDLTVQMQKQGGLDENNNPVGGNQLFDFCRWFKTLNNNSIVTSNPDTSINEKTANNDYLINGTDFFAPYRVRAVNNADGDKSENDDYTGGNHQYNNSGSGSTATARTANLVFKVDGKPITNFSGYCDEVIIEWDNFIQGNNTKKSDGSGREILKEHHVVRFDGYRFYVENYITALEDIYIYTYYGLQMRHEYTTSSYYQFLGSKTSKSTYLPQNYVEQVTQRRYSGDKYSRDITNYNGESTRPFYLDKRMMHIDEVGLGDFEYVKSNDSSCFASNGKMYFNLIAGFDEENKTIDMNNVLNLSENDCVFFRGWYEFSKKN